MNCLSVPLLYYFLGQKALCASTYVHCNCPIHRPSFVAEAMNERGYVLIVDECWMKIEINSKSNP